MTKLWRYVWLRVTFAIVSIPVTFFLFVSAESKGEAWLDGSILRLFVGNRIPLRSGAALLLVPVGHHPAFWVVVTASCSALAPMLSLACLAPVLPKASRGRRWLALGAAIGFVFIGNMIRIDSSILVGLVAGSVSLVLFHNWIGSAFGFAYVLGGYILMLFILLPNTRNGVSTSGNSDNSLGIAKNKLPYSTTAQRVLTMNSRESGK